jgi:hypothetical protein
MKSFYMCKGQVGCFANDNDAYIPEQWAQEGLAILEENMVIASLVHRDFEDEIRNFGDVVNTRKPGTFRISRKKDGTTLTQQDASATNVPVALDQWFYTSFVIKDGEASKAFQDLVDIYLRPGMQSIARAIDRAVLGRVHNFILTPAKRSGKLQGLTGTNAKDYVLEVREILSNNKAPTDGRVLVLAPSSETALLKTDMFVKANERGDGGTALETAVLGHILGFTTYMDQNVNSVSKSSMYGQYTEGTITSALAAGGSGSQACTLARVAVDGEYLTVAGNDQPTYITACTTGGGATTAVTLNEANKYATDALAVLTNYEACAVKGNYLTGYSEAVVLDGWTVAPAVGQLVAFGVSTARKVYTVIESWLSATGEQSVILDRPLEGTVGANAIIDNQAAFPGPAGVFNLAFHRDALALVTRPLATPSAQMGVMSHVGAYNGIAMRVTMQYDIQEGGTVVNLDILAGVAVLDTDLAVVLLG